MNGAEHERAGFPAPAATRMRPLAAMVAWLPVLAWMALIVLLSGDRFGDATTANWLARIPLLRALGVSPAAIATANLIVRKCAHFVEYAVLGVLLMRAVHATWPALRPAQLVTVSLTVAVLYAGADELRQYTTTVTRTGKPRDVLLDAAGALTGAALMTRRRPRAA